MGHAWAHTWKGQEAPDSLPTMVWLHGWGLNYSYMERLSHLFERDGRHILFDLPGFGQTPMLAKGAGTRDYAELLAQQLDNCLDKNKHGNNKPEKVILVGHSFGARVAVQLAAHYPDRVAGIILIAGAGLQPRRSLAWQTRALSLKALSRFCRWIDSMFASQTHKTFRARFGSTDYKNAGLLRETFVRVVNEDLVSEAMTVRCPALLLYGSEDKETPIDIGSRYESLISIARLEILPGFGHLDILDRGAYQLEAHMRRFFSDCNLKQTQQVD